MTILGFTDSKNECDCGKTGLKGVYIVETGNGETLNLGSSCVKKNWDLNQKEFKTKVKEGFVITSNDLIANKYVLLQRGKKSYFLLKVV